MPKGVYSCKPDHALIQQSVILNYAKPGKSDLHYLQDYLQSDEMGNLALLGQDAYVWGSCSARNAFKCDLIALKPRGKEDPFSAWAAQNAIIGLVKCGCARFLKPSPVHGVVGYEEGTIYLITYCITSILASLIPIVSIVVLYFVRSMPARLGTIAVFNVLISICLMALAGAKRAEVFAITAAYVQTYMLIIPQLTLLGLLLYRWCSLGRINAHQRALDKYGGGMFLLMKTRYACSLPFIMCKV